MPNLAAIQGFINAATRIVPVLEAIVGQITGLIGPLTTDVEAAIEAWLVHADADAHVGGGRGVAARRGQGGQCQGGGGQQAVQ